MTSSRESQGAEAGGTCESIKDTLLCPHCHQRLKKWATADDPFSQWNADFLYICFNDDCPYFRNGWKVMSRQGRPGISYRLSYDPRRDTCMPIAVASSEALKGWIVED